MQQELFSAEIYAKPNLSRNIYYIYGLGINTSTVLNIFYLKWFGRPDDPRSEYPMHLDICSNNSKYVYGIDYI